MTKLEIQSRLSWIKQFRTDLSDFYDAKRACTHIMPHGTMSGLKSATYSLEQEQKALFTQLEAIDGADQSRAAAEVVEDNPERS